MGAEGQGVMRAIIEVLRDGFEYLVEGKDEAVTAKMILEELGTGDWDEFFEEGPLGASGRPQ